MRQPQDTEVTRAWGGSVAPLALAALAAIYLAAVFAEGFKVGSAGRFLPAPLAYFAQIAGLFPHSARYGHDFRAEGYLCSEKRWAEIDVAPYFPIDADNKENRFYRAIHFYYELKPHRPTMQALDDFLVSLYNGDAIDAAASGRGSRPLIGGVRFVKLRLPFGKPGDGAERYVRRPLDAHPDEMRTPLYHTPESKREARCEKNRALKAGKPRPQRVELASDPGPPPPKGVVPRADPPLPRAFSLPSVAVIGRWFNAPQPVLRLEIIRIWAPLATLGFMSSRLAHADEWLSSAGFQVPEIPGGDWRQPLYLSPLSPTMAWAVAGVMVLSGLAVAVGFRARRAALVFALTLAYVALADRLAAFTVTKLSPAVMLALAASPCGSRFSVDAWLRRRRSPEAAVPSLVSAGGPRFFQALLAVFYCASGVSKLHGDWMKHPLVLWTHVHDSYQTAFSWAIANALPAWAWTGLQTVTLIFELLAPLWFAVRQSRPVALAWAVAMHLMIGMMFWPVRWFSWLMITLVVGAFLSEEWLDRVAARFDQTF